MQPETGGETQSSPEDVPYAGARGRKHCIHSDAQKGSNSSQIFILQSQGHCLIANMIELGSL